VNDAAHEGRFPTHPNISPGLCPPYLDTSTDLAPVLQKCASICATTAIALSCRPFLLQDYFSDPILLTWATLDPIPLCG
jgi:hypothetical protein